MKTQSDSIAAIVAALVRAQAQIAPAPKNATNPHYRSHYADLASVWEVCRSPLAANGLAIIQSPVDVGEGRVGLTTTLAHSSGEWISATVSAPLSRNDPQSVGSALTYLRRYSLAATVGVTTTEDDDAEAATAPSRHGEARTAAPSRPTPESPSPQPKATGGKPSPVDDSYIVTSVDTKDGVSKAGKPYTRYAVMLESRDGGIIRATTFDDGLASEARCAHGAGQRVKAMLRQTQYGHDLMELFVIDTSTDTPSALAQIDGIPF
jgi:hypothetical protein